MNETNVAYLGAQVAQKEADKLRHAMKGRRNEWK